MTSSGTPRAAAVVAAARALATWNDPASASSTRRPRHGTTCRSAALSTSLTSASEYPTVGTPARVEQPPAPGVVRVDHGQRGALGREQRRLGREVGLHRPVVVEVVVATGW